MGAHSCQFLVVQPFLTMAFGTSSFCSSQPGPSLAPCVQLALEGPFSMDTTFLSSVPPLRKGALLMNNLLAFFAATLMGASFPTGLFELLIVGRFLIGMNTGIGLCVQPLYIGEAAPRHLRGAVAMGSSIFLTGGILTGQVMGLRELLGGEECWPFLLSSCCLPAIIQLLSLPWFPESPRFTLLDRGDEGQCVKALKRFHGPLHYQKELEDIQRENFALGGEKAKKPWELFADRSIRWQLIAVICLTMGQQLSGINAIYFYANYVFAETGIPPEKIPYVTLGTGMCECLTALTCGLLVESLGRRALILRGYCLMMLWCFILTISLNFQKGLKQYCFIVFLLECSAVATFIFCIIPETKNKTFLEIKREFHKLNFRRAKEPYEESCERQQLCPEV